MLAGGASASGTASGSGGVAAHAQLPLAVWQSAVVAWWQSVVLNVSTFESFANHWQQHHQHGTGTY